MRNSREVGSVGLSLLVAVSAAFGALASNLLVPARQALSGKLDESLAPASESFSRDVTSDNSVAADEDVSIKLDELQASIAHLIALVKAGNPGPQSRSPERESTMTDQLALGVTQLQTSVEELSNRIDLHSGNQAPPTLEQIRKGKQETDWPQIRLLYEEWRNDPEAISKQLSFSPYEEVLGKFGPPTKINPKGVWTYVRITPEKQDPRGLELQFIGGYVTVGNFWLW